jgi:hypothetical protein
LVARADAGSLKAATTGTANEVAVAYPGVLSEPSETLPILEQRFTEHPLAFVLLDKAWPHGHTAIERADVGRQRNGVLAKIVALQERIATMVEPARA